MLRVFRDIRVNWSRRVKKLFRTVDDDACEKFEGLLR